MVNEIRGAKWWSGHLERSDQEALVETIRSVARQVPMFHPVTRFGKKMSVKMTSAGRVGWVSDRRGYRYEHTHPTGRPWPDIPTEILSIWQDVTGLGRMPDCCLINYYGQASGMGMHQDRDEGSFDWPVVSLSLGDDALFRIGGRERGGSNESFWLSSGDIVVLEGASRLAFHGIDKTRFGSSSLLKGGGRLNLTLRVVDSA